VCLYKGVNRRVKKKMFMVYRFLFVYLFISLYAVYGLWVISYKLGLENTDMAS
jgi:hypothetical protein